MMKCLNNRADHVTIAYIGGGSRGWAWTFMTDLALEPAMSGVIRLYDIDREGLYCTLTDRRTTNHRGSTKETIPHHLRRSAVAV